jgi:hypothetical protein
MPAEGRFAGPTPPAAGRLAAPKGPLAGARFGAPAVLLAGVPFGFAAVRVVNAEPGFAKPPALLRRGDAGAFAGRAPGAPDLTGRSPETGRGAAPPLPAGDPGFCAAARCGPALALAVGLPAGRAARPPVAFWPAPAAFLVWRAARRRAVPALPPVPVSGLGRHTTRSFPMACTGAQPRRAQISSSICRRLSRSSPRTRILMRPCALSARSVSASTASVRPASPTTTTGSR